VAPGRDVISWNELSPDQLLALIAVNLGPVEHCSDGRWRSSWKHFPLDGIDEDDLRRLGRARFIERAGCAAVVTEAGRAALAAFQINWPSTAATPARGCARELHSSLQ
jgi:hypothetical protein